MVKIRSAITGLSLLLRVLLPLLSVSECFVLTQGVGFGINYGQIANNLPSPSRVALLIQSMNVSRIKLYDADPNVLLAFANSNVEFVVGLGNEYLQSMRDPAKAQTWIQQHLQPYLSRTKITCITVGNEVFDSKDTQLISSLLPAMQSVHDALVNLGLDQQVSVTSAHSYKILTKSYPPSSGTFRQDLIQYIQPILGFHAQIKSPFLINAYPFFAYKDNPNEVPLNYVLFQPNPGVTDPNTKLHYDNMLFAQIDAVYYAIKALGFSDIEVRISETGWPSKGDPDEIGATPENAGIYNANLVKIMEQKQGTPANPSVPIDIYVFALFNENLKPGPTSERNYGLYYPDGTPVYNLGLQGYLPEMIISSKSNDSFILERFPDRDKRGLSRDHRKMWVFGISLFSTRKMAKIPKASKLLLVGKFCTPINRHAAALGWTLEMEYSDSMEGSYNTYEAFLISSKYYPVGRWFCCTCRTIECIIVASEPDILFYAFSSQKDFLARCNDLY